MYLGRVHTQHNYHPWLECCRYVLQCDEDAGCVTTKSPLWFFLRFFEDLERRHYENPVIRDISDIVQNHASNHFEPYIVYCSNETFQQRTLQMLLWVSEYSCPNPPALVENNRVQWGCSSARSSNTAFKETLKHIEGSSECGGLPMISFLILPMQRVTRLPLLLDVGWPFSPPPPPPHTLLNWSGTSLLLNSFPVLVRTADNMPENKGQNSRVLCCRVGAARHEQGRDVGSGSPGGKGTSSSPHSRIVMWLLWLLVQQLVNSCNNGARRMERTEQMYTIQKQMEFGKIKVRPRQLPGQKSRAECRCSWNLHCVSAAVSSGLIVPVAEEARRAGGLQRRAQHLEGFQPQELLPVSLQWRSDHHQEEKVSTSEGCVLCWKGCFNIIACIREGSGGDLIKIGANGEELGGMCEWAFPAGLWMLRWSSCWQTERGGEGTGTGKGRTVHVVRAYLRFFNLEFSVSAQEDRSVLT